MAYLTALALGFAVMLVTCLFSAAATEFGNGCTASNAINAITIIANASADATTARPRLAV